MEYTVCKRFDIDQMCNLRKSVGWNELKTMMSNASGAYLLFDAE